MTVTDGSSQNGLRQGPEPRQGAERRQSRHE